MSASAEFDGLAPEIIARPDETVKHAPGQLEPLDEVVARNANVHIERLSDGHVWASIAVGDKTIRLGFWTKGRAKLYFGGEDDS